MEGAAGDDAGAEGGAETGATDDDDDVVTCAAMGQTVVETTIVSVVTDVVFIQAGHLVTVTGQAVMVDVRVLKAVEVVMAGPEEAVPIGVDVTFTGQMVVPITIVSVVTEMDWEPVGHVGHPVTVDVLVVTRTDVLCVKVGLDELVALVTVTGTEDELWVEAGLDEAVAEPVLVANEDVVFGEQARLREDQVDVVDVVVVFGEQTRWREDQVEVVTGREVAEVLGLEEQTRVLDGDDEVTGVEDAVGVTDLDLDLQAFLGSESPSVSDLAEIFVRDVSVSVLVCEDWLDATHSLALSRHLKHIDLDHSRAAC